MAVDSINISDAHFTIVQPCIVFLRFFGTLPVHCKRNGKEVFVKFSTGYWIYSLILSLPVAAVRLYGLTTVVKNKKFVNSGFFKILMYSDVISGVVEIIFWSFTLPLEVKSFVKFLKKLSEVDEVIRLQNIRKYKKYSVIAVSAVSFAYVALLSYMLLTIIIVRGLPSGPKGILQATIVISIITLYVQLFLRITHIIYFGHLVFFVRIRLLLINRILQAECGKHLDIAKREKYYCSKYLNQHRGCLKRRLQNLLMCQEKLYEAVKIIKSRYHGFKIIILLSVILNSALNWQYYILKQFSCGAQTRMAFSEELWVCLDILEIVLSFEICHLCYSEGLKMRDIIRQTLLTNNIFDKKITNIIVSTMTTYLVVLCQFNRDVVC